MRLMVLSVMGLIAGLGLAAAIVAVPVMAEKGPPTHHPGGSSWW